MWKGGKKYCTTSSFPTHVIEIYLSANKERALAVSSQCLEEPLNMCCWQKNRIVITQPSVFLAVKQKEPCDFLKTSLMWLWKKRTLCRTMTDTGISSILFSLPCSASRFCLVLSFFFFPPTFRTKARGLVETICAQSRKLCGSEACHITKGRDQEDVLLGAVIVSALLARTFPYRWTFKWRLTDICFLLFYRTAKPEAAPKILCITPRANHLCLRYVTQQVPSCKIRTHGIALFLCVWAAWRGSNRVQESARLWGYARSTGTPSCARPVLESQPRTWIVVTCHYKHASIVTRKVERASPNMVNDVYSCVCQHVSLCPSLIWPLLKTTNFLWNSH